MKKHRCSLILLSLLLACATLNIERSQATASADAHKSTGRSYSALPDSETLLWTDASEKASSNILKYTPVSTGVLDSRNYAGVRFTHVDCSLHSVRSHQVPYSRPPPA